MPIIPANPSAYDLQKISNTILTLGLFILSVYLFMGGMLFIILFLFPASYLTPSSTLLQTGALYSILHSLVTYVIFTHYL